MSQFHHARVACDVLRASVRWSGGRRQSSPEYFDGPSAAAVGSWDDLRDVTRRLRAFIVEFRHEGPSARRISSPSSHDLLLTPAGASPADPFVFRLPQRAFFLAPRSEEPRSPRFFARPCSRSRRSGSSHAISFDLVRHRSSTGAKGIQDEGHGARVRHALPDMVRHALPGMQNYCAGSPRNVQDLHGGSFFTHNGKLTAGKNFVLGRILDHQLLSAGIDHRKNSMPY